MGTKRRRFGYADDVGILNIGKTLEETAADATRELRELIEWGADNTIEFDPAKTEVVHFSRKRNADNPPVWHSTHEKTAESSMRWLGILLDRRLRFKDHVTHWAKKASRVANHIRGLCNTTRGLPVESTRKAVVACVLPILTHGLEAWYPGLAKTNKDESKSSCRVKQQLRQMDSVLRTAMRAVLPVWKTHPSHILHFESQIPPAEILAESIRRRHGFRLGRVDKNHPLVGRLPVQARKDATRLQRCYQLVPTFARPAISKPSFAKPPRRGDKEEEAKFFRDWLRERDETRDLVVYSDGSQIEEQGATRTGWGYTIRKGGTTQEVYRGKGRLLHAEVEDAEVYGALMGLAAARAIGRDKRLYVCLDNTSVVDGLNGTPPESSRSIFIRFKDLAGAHGPGVTVKWIPGHKDIEGNEGSCRQAREGRCHAGLGSHKRTNGCMGQAVYQRAEKDEPRYRGVKSHAVVSKHLALFKRKTLHRLLAARSGHGDFAQYYERFQHADSNNYCSCGERKTPQHIFCGRLRKHRLLPTRTPRTAFSTFLGEESVEWARFVEKTNFYTRICPR